MNFQSLAKPENRWRLVIFAAAVSGIIGVYGISQFRQTPKPSEVAAQPTAPPMRKITALGRLEPEQEVIKVSVPATLSNDRVAQLLVQRGDRIESNQVIAILDSRNRLQNALLEAQAQVKIVQAELAKVKAGAKSGEIAAQDAEVIRFKEELKGETATQQATIARWEAEVEVAQADYDRYAQLYKDGAFAASDLDQRRLTLETAQAQLNEAKAQQRQSIKTLQEQIKQARATLNEVSEVRPVDVQSAEAEVDKAIASVKKAEADLEEAYIRAPMAGRIFEIYAKPGEVVGEEGIAEIGQTNQMQVVAEVYQTDIQEIIAGQPAMITSESFSGELSGTVRLIGLQVTQQDVTSGQPGENLDRRVIEVRIRLNLEDSQRVANLTNLQVQVAIQPKNSSPP